MTDPNQFDVFLYYPWGSSSYNALKLHCETLQLVASRTPSVFPIPGVRADTTGEPGAFALDFGMMKEDVIVRGYMADTEQFVGEELVTTSPYVRWSDMEYLFRTRWISYTMGSSPSRPCMLVYYDDAGQYYDLYVLPGRLHLTREPAKAEWRYSATFYTVKWSWT